MVFAVAAVALLLAPHSEDDFGTVLRLVVRAAKEKFRPVQGARFEFHPGGHSYYEARISIPGTSECRVDVKPELIYSCHWKSPDGKPGCERLSADVAAALGREWSRERIRKPKPAVIFEAPGKASGRVRLTPAAGGCSLAVIADQQSGN